MTEQKQSEQPPQARIRPVEIYWTTVTYKTVAIYAVLILGIVVLGLYIAMPERMTSLLRKATGAMGGSDGSAAPMLTQARFVNLDGKVQVKKVNTTQWASADYRMSLDKGDLIQTGTDGVARLTFADGTTYTVKNDTLIMVEENVVGPDRPTRVGVAITSGALDLSTAGWEANGSHAEVRFPADQSVASIQQNSRASVRSDPQSKQNEITVSAGGAQLQRGEERVELGRYERATFAPGGPVSKSQVLSPPELVSPGNLQPIIVPDPAKTPVKFEWKPVGEAVHYTLRISATSMFSRIVAEKQVKAPSAEVTGLEPGDYFWAVVATDAQNRSSESSDVNKFTLAAQGKSQEMQLEIESTQLHGTVVEIRGLTEPGAALMINGQAVAQIDKDGHFLYFTPPQPRGAQTLVIVGQNRRGGTTTKTISIVVP
ncbi:MAG TPA: hypothetical protein VKG84_05110 [Candidatus Acidoferrales bacterium]|nr:hypothetical protein [Candidatus Acidoferrales bacterium]